MASQLSRFERFWKEMKRRKVVHVVTVYAAVSFVILQLVDIITSPLQLPSWTLPLVIVLICIGFVLSVLLSWIYDITPKGVKKTKSIKPSKGEKALNVPAETGTWKIISYVSIALIIALLSFNIINGKRLRNLSKLEKSIAVLPFVNDSPSDSTSYFINGVMEEILNNLQKIKNFRVLSRTSTDQYKGPDRPTVPEIAKKLGVNYIVEGSGQKYGNEFKLRVQLIQAKGKESHLWGKSYEQEIKEAKDIFDIQSEIAQSIAVELRTTITPEEKQYIEKIPTKNLDAYDDYLKGQFYYRKFTQQDWDLALKYFKQAIEKDAGFALPYAGISQVWMMRTGFSSPPPDAITKAVAAINKALELDSSRSEIYLALGSIQCYVDWDWKGSELSIRKAIEINPNNADAISGYGNVLLILGRLKEALEKTELATKLDPLNPLAMNNYGAALMFDRRYDDAIREFSEVLKMAPGSEFALSCLAGTLDSKGKYEEALTAWKTYYSTVYKDFIHVFDLGYSKGGYKAAMNLEADTLAAQLKTKRINPTEIAILYACGGNKEKAIKMLEYAYEIHDTNIAYLLLPPYDILRDDPRFQEIGRKLKLPYKYLPD